jgi:drug/metabolite transporter (DMT)-like permease
LKPAGRPALAWSGLVLASLFWAGNALVARAFHDAITPFSLSFWRWLLAFALLLPFVALPLLRQRQALRAAGWRLWVLAALGIGGYSLLLYFAAQTTSAINITLLGISLPLMLFVGSGLMLGEWPQRNAWWGMALAVPGLLVLISSGSLRALLQLSFTPGDLLMLLAVVDWTLYSLLLRRWSSWLAPIPQLSLLAVLMGLGVILLAPLYLLDLLQGRHFAPTAANFAAIAYTAVFPSLFAYLAWNYGVQQLGAARTSLSNYLMPVFTAILGWLLLDEGLQGYHWTGAALIFAGLALANRPHAAGKQAAASQ